MSDLRMNKKDKKGIHQLYQNNPSQADKALWGRITPLGRRGFIKKSALATMNAVLGANMVFAEHFPAGMIPALLYHSTEPFQIPGKSEQLVVLNDRPINAETPAHLLDPEWTPNDLFFVRNNGIPPENVNPKSWTLTIEGESAKTTKRYSLEDLKNNFPTVHYYLTLECGGNGRKEFNPPAKGNQWSTGAVGCAKWTGVKLKDLLEDVGIKKDAVYITYYGKDTHLSGDPNKTVISRGVPIEKALQEESMVVWAMNDQALPVMNGYPLRLVFGGWPASCSGKWLQKIAIRNKIHDGPKMTGQSYRVPCKPVPPGTKVADEDMCIIEAMPVKSLITYPKSGAMISLNRTLNIRGHAWAGDAAVKNIEYSIDFGRSWNPCTISTPENRNAWQHFEAQVKFPETGYYELWAKATDENGQSQPMILPGWNPRGYLNNACHRIAIKVQ